MTMCQKCWTDAELRASLEGGAVFEHYCDILDERAAHPCSPAEQAGYTEAEFNDNS